MKNRDIQKCPEINDPVDTHIWEPISFLIAKSMAKKHWSPNVATYISLVTGMIGGFMFGCRNIWVNVAGAVLFLLAIIFDCADGQIARLNKCGSIYGRMLDGFCDGFVYLAAYLGLAIHCFFDQIPFTDVQWSWWIFLLAIPAGAWFHGRQARIADYYKNTYMWIVGLHSELMGVAELEEKYNEDKVNLSLINKLSFKSYISYTKTQEKETKGVQLLRKKIAENNNVIPEEVAQEFKKHVWLFKLGNLETVNLRTFVLIGLLLSGLGCWHFVFIIFILEPINLILQCRIEKLAKKCAKEYFK